MKRPYLLSLLIFCFSIFTYGTIVGKYKVFPYYLIKMVKNNIAPNFYFSKPNPSTANAHKLFKYFSPKADIAFIGDSLTDGGEWSDFFPNKRVVNRGVGLDKASDILIRIDSIISTKPGKAYIMVGINDIYQYVPVYDILENYSLIVDALLNANAEVVIQSTIQCQLSKCGTKFVNSVNTLNDGLEELATEKEVSFLNLEELSDQAGLDSKYTTDGIHLNAEGYLYWVQKLLPTLK